MRWKEKIFGKEHNSFASECEVSQGNAKYLQDNAKALTGLFFLPSHIFIRHHVLLGALYETTHNSFGI